MDSVFVCNVLGLAATLLVQGVFASAAWGLKGKRGQPWVFYYLALMMTAATLLMVGALIGVKAEIPVLIGLVALTLRGGRSLPWRSLARPRAWQWVPVVAISVAAVYAALPVFRADQWTYHLVIAKQVASLGRLASPMLNDHIYFSGPYEYLFLLPRLVTDHDTFVQSFADAFTLLTFLLATGGVLDLWYRRFLVRRPGRAWMLAFVLFSMPTADMLVNAKPDSLMVPIALAVLLCVARIWNEDARESRDAGFWLGFFLVAPLALKLTWAHFALAACIPVGVSLIRGKLPLGATFAGGLVGALLLAALLGKNVYFFANPFHPMQALGFVSNPWSDMAAEYWRYTSRRPDTFGGYLSHYVNVLWYWPWQLRYFLLPALLGVFFLRVRHKAFETVWPLCLALAGYVAVWPFIYGYDIYARFVYPLVAPVIGLVLVSIAGVPPRNVWLGLLVAAPIFLNGKLEVGLMQMVKAWPLSMHEFYATFPHPMGERNFYQDINEHRHRHHPGSRMDEHRLLSDNNSAYFFDGQLLFFNGYVFDWIWRGDDSSPPGDCLWHWARYWDVRYLFSWETPFVSWPERLAPLVTAATAVDDTGRVLYLSPDSVSERLGADPASCRGAQD